MTWLLLLVAVVLLPLPTRATTGPGVRLPHGRRPTTDSDDQVAWILALAGELRAGSDALRALQVCSRRHGVAPRAARAAALGGDVAAALREDSATAPVLSSIAAAWSISQQTGAGLAEVLENVADGHRRTIEVRRSLAVELAGPRATARLMSLLPAIGVGFAMLLGADPLRWFLTTLSGMSCLCAGIALNLAGFWWLRALVHRVESDL